MLLEKLEAQVSVEPLVGLGNSKLKIAAFYVLGTIALVATVVFLLKIEEPVEYQQQFGAYGASR
jgi:hypothetical protein